MEKGDLIWQDRLPGGVCILVRAFNSEEEYDRKNVGWADSDWPIFRVFHGKEGVIDDPSYYYCTLEENDKHLKAISLMRKRKTRGDK